MKHELDGWPRTDANLILNYRNHFNEFVSNNEFCRQGIAITGK